MQEPRPRRGQGGQHARGWAGLSTVPYKSKLSCIRLRCRLVSPAEEARMAHHQNTGSKLAHADWFAFLLVFTSVFTVACAAS